MVATNSSWRLLRCQDYAAVTKLTAPAGVPVDVDGVTPLGGADAIVNKSAEDVLRRLPVCLHGASMMYTLTGLHTPHTSLRCPHLIVDFMRVDISTCNCRTRASRRPTTGS
jgi:hypothetical protein